MDQLEFLDRVVECLDRCGVEHMVTGSLASGYHGEPRATRDIDFVIDCDERQLSELLARVHAHGWYVSDDAAHDALRRRSMFNVIETAYGHKADLMIRRDRPFSIEEFGRRRRVELLDARDVSVASAEDTILAKLEWSSETESDRQRLDALGVVRASVSLDLEYLRRWATELGLRDDLEKILAGDTE